MRRKKVENNWKGWKESFFFFKSADVSALALKGLVLSFDVIFFFCGIMKSKYFCWNAKILFCKGKGNRVRERIQSKRVKKASLKVFFFCMDNEDGGRDRIKSILKAWCDIWKNDNMRRS